MVGLAVSSCAGIQGVEQFEAYRAAFDKTYGASTAILDQLAVQERALFLRRHPINGRTSSQRFDPSLARYYTDAVDPPGTAAFRHSIDLVKAYNELLYGLATGQTAATLTAKVGQLNSKIVDAAGEAGALLGIANQAKIQVLGGLLKAAFTQAQPFVQMGLTYQSREEFRRYVIEYHEPVRAILVELRQGTEAIFPVLTAATLRRSRDATGVADGKLTQQEIEKLEGYRKLLADWVILIDATIKSIDLARAAAEAAPTLSGSITGLTTVATELETASQAARKHLAELATK
ncbi:hypothetical protein HL667_03010 [Bradyrhizobium sp. 83012]|uniref:Chemotaxis protein n=1 Tax=Bradyrhizobium aeschynomenes TaxID=2734909 RepID=A0ABX2C8Q3_9BRAD|nr:hypothetical protein [Bradyrhizobium aeschynomenes]NPU12816.1 hypothetical protein [Bradyrhizobium aeschynomenes]NPU63960.1 hypothetical protein [Bradyrhizobium aeschynomenes]NPV23137.1 hypothetical protein [Bradyrhizobium aeschynomenes]